MSGFNNPIIGGGGGLVYPAIKSPNYAAGTAGWKVSKDGSAEFNDLAIRGTFSGTNYVINTDGLFFYSPSEGAGNLIASIAAAAGTDAYGNAYPAGLWAKNTGGISGGLSMSTGRADESVNAYLATSVANQGTVSEAQAVQLGSAKDSAYPDVALLYLTSSAHDGSLRAGGYLYYQDTTNTDHLIAYWDSAGFHVVSPLFGTGGTLTIGDDVSMASGKTISADTWHNITMLNGWSVPAGYVAQYRLLPDGDVEMKGRVTGTTAGTAADVWGSIPAAYRPAANRTCPVAITNNAPGTGTARIYIPTTGQIQIPGYASSGVSVTFSLDSVRYSL